MPEEPPEMQPLLALAAAGDRAAWGALLASYQERLARMVAFRMDDRLRGRIDASDVVQDGLLAASAHRVEYFRAAGAPLLCWLRGVVMKKLLELHRYHLGTRMRDAKRELPLDAVRCPDGTTAAGCAHLTGHLTSPSVAAARVEVRTRLTEALSEMDPTDREVPRQHPRSRQRIKPVTPRSKLRPLRDATLFRRTGRGLRRLSCLSRQGPVAQFVYQGHGFGRTGRRGRRRSDRCAWSVGPPKA